METAGRFGLNLLLLWAGIVTLASSSAASPALTTHASTVTKTNVTDSVAPQTSTQTPPGPPLHQSSTNPTSNVLTTRTQISTRPKLLDATRSASTQPPLVPSCSYTLHPIQFGFRINIENFSSDQTFTLTLEDQTDGTTEQYYVKNAVDNFLGLKPCTDYRHNLSFTLNMNLSYCEQSGSGKVTNPPATTQPLKSADFMNAERIKDKICYQSQWNIYNSVFEVHTKNKTQFCITYDDFDICANFMKNVPTNCNSPITLSKFIDLDSSDIKMTPVDGYPKEFTLPPNCKNWTVSHTCSEKDNSHGSRSLSELEPYTDYRCTATVTRENATRTRHVDVGIDCKLQLNKISNTIITNTSMDMRWKLSSSVCEDHLTRFHFSYECQCNDTHKGGRHDVNFLEAPCHFSGLRVYTNYKCGINVKYNNETISSSSHTFQTGPGRPEKPHIKFLAVKGRNGITVTWEKIRTFYGPKEMYIVRLFEGDTQKEEKNIIQEKEKNIAEVVFEHLSYSTSYTVKVTAFNGHMESESSVGSISTSYDEILIRFPIFLILTFAVLIFVAYKISILRRERSRRRGRPRRQLPDQD